jgi:hypothetical protein
LFCRVLRAGVDWPRNERIDYANYVELLPPDGGSVSLFESDGHAQLVGAESTPVADGKVSPAYVYVRVDDVETAATRVEEAVRATAQPARAAVVGDEAAWFADPDGHGGRAVGLSR